MTVSRVTVTLEQSEYSGLLELAVRELRDPPGQLRHILREELKRRGLLPNYDSERQTLPRQEAVGE